MAEGEFTEKKVSANFREIGRSGTLITSETIENDYIAELNGTSGQEKYFNVLLSDSQVRKLYHSVSNPIKSANWTIEPASDEKKDVDIADLINQILFCDIPGGFVGKLDEILTFPWHGHAVFEPVHKNIISKKFGPYTSLANLAFRDQRTLDKWIFSREGMLEKIHQIQSGDVEIDVDIPAENLVIFYNEKKGNDNGYPFCRMLYGNYKRKLLYKQLQAIGIEKGAIGVPILTLPPGVEYDSDEFAAAESQLTAYTQAESAHIILPDLYKLDLDQSNTFDPSKVQVAIKAENEEISGSLVAMWLEMGIGGNSAVGSSTGISADFFKDGIEYIADKIVDVFNSELIPSLVALNFGDVDELPKLKHSGIADEAGKELMEVVTGYVSSGVITADSPLEDHVRKEHNLPPKSETEEIVKEEDPKKPDPVKDEKEEVELSEHVKAKTPKRLIESQAKKISRQLRDSMNFSSRKYINDVIARYKQLPESKKQNATSKVKMGGSNNLKKDLKRLLTESFVLAVDMARKEIPGTNDVQLSSKDSDMLRMSDKYGDITDVKLNEFSKLPTHIQVLIAKQSELISASVLAELKKRADFSFSTIETKSIDENLIKQIMEERTDKYINSNVVDTSGTNVSAMMVNEGRDAFFFDDDVIGQIHSFTFINAAPVSPICRELAGTTFNTNDAQSLVFTPPLHHGCKSYLRANLNVSKGVEKLNVSKLAPSAKAQESITL